MDISQLYHGRHIVPLTHKISRQYLRGDRRSAVEQPELSSNTISNVESRVSHEQHITSSLFQTSHPRTTSESISILNHGPSTAHNHQRRNPNHRRCAPDPATPRLREPLRALAVSSRRMFTSTHPPCRWCKLHHPRDSRVAVGRGRQH